MPTDAGSVFGQVIPAACALWKRTSLSKTDAASPGSMPMTFRDLACPARVPYLWKAKSSSGRRGMKRLSPQDDASLSNSSKKEGSEASGICTNLSTRSVAVTRWRGFVSSPTTYTSPPQFFRRDVIAAKAVPLPAAPIIIFFFIIFFCASDNHFHHTRRPQRPSARSRG